MDISFMIFSVIVIASITIYFLKKTPEKIPEKVIRIETREPGDLYQLCPCKAGLICDQGFCKIENGLECISSLSCTSDNFCFNGICMDREKLMIESDKIEYDRNILKLKNDRFVMLPGWWAY